MFEIQLHAYRAHSGMLRETGRPCKRYSVKDRATVRDYCYYYCYYYYPDDDDDDDDYDEYDYSCHY